METTYIVKDWNRPGYPVVGTAVRTGKVWTGTRNDGTTVGPFKTLKATDAALKAAGDK